jgi:PPM family protein phosphatase
MGGAQAGEVASKMAVERFEQGLPDEGAPEERLTSAIQEANQRIHDLSRPGSKHEGMGTTLTAAYLDDSELAIAHVGDSRAYLFRDGTLQRLTQDHSLVDELVRRGKLTEEQAAEHPQRSIITRALGPEAPVEVDTSLFPVRAGDILLLCSDGLTSMITEDRMSEILRAAGSLESAGDELIKAANDAGGRDNITVVLVRLEDVGTDGAADEHTIVAPPATRAQAAGKKSGEAPAPAPPVAVATPSARVPLARTQGRPASQPTQERRLSRRGKVLAAAAAAVIVLVLILGGGYLASRQLYFISTNQQGIVTIYRGLPYTLPAGVKLYETFYVSGVPASLVPADRRGALFNDDLRSQSDASALVRDLELGKLSP